MDLSNFTKKWYDKDITELQKEFNLLPVGQSGLKNNDSLLSSNRVIGTTENTAFMMNNDSIISGGPCIDDCSKDISIEPIYEIASLIKVGKSLGKTVIIHIGIQEEILRKKQSAAAIKRWKNIGDQYELLIKSLSNILGHDQVISLRSDDPVIDTAIIEFTKNIEQYITLDDAITLYQHLLKIKPVVKDSFNFGIHLRYLSLYIPDFIDKVLGIQDSKLLVYEDIQQLMACKKARAIATLQNKYYQGPYQIVTLPYPGIDGSIRMHRYDKEMRPYLNTPQQKMQKIVNSMTDDVFEFNKNTWPLELTGDRIITRDQLIKFFCNLKEECQVDQIQ